MLVNLWRTHKQGFSRDSYSWTHQGRPTTKNYIHQLRHEDLPVVMAKGKSSEFELSPNFDDDRDYFIILKAILKPQLRLKYSILL